MMIGRAQQNYWKLKAVDAISNDATPDQKDGFINSIIMDSDLKKALLSGNKSKGLMVPQQTLLL
jgi:hypothetical protein